MAGALSTILTDPPYGDGVDEAKVRSRGQISHTMLTVVFFQINSGRVSRLPLFYSSSIPHAQLISPP